MNEPVFGDPSRIRDENRRSIFNGVGLGCGGCALLVCLGVSMIMATVALVFWLFFHDEAAQIAFQRAKDSAAVKQALGEPMERGWWSMGHSTTNNGDAEVNLDFSISGAQDEATLSFHAEKQQGRDWVFHQLTVKPSKSAQIIDLCILENEDSAKK